MVCVYCKHDTKVVNSRKSPRHNKVWRRRACLSCHSIFTTSEMPDLEISMRVKTPSGALEPLYRDKLYLSVYFSVSHRKTPEIDATGLTETIISQVLSSKKPVSTTKEIKHITHQVLSNFDKASAVYYSVHY